jgi:hypothetical protein
MGGDGAPKPVDPYVSADAQFKYQRDVSRLTDSYGSRDWINQGTSLKPKWVQQVKLNPTSQKIFDVTNAGALTSAYQAKNELNKSNYDPTKVFQAAQYQLGQMNDSDIKNVQQQLRSLPGADLATRQHVEDALIARMNPQLQQDEEALRTRLANQGIQYNAEAYGNAMRDYNQRVNDARYGAIAQGGEEMARNQQMNLARIGAMGDVANMRQNMNLQRIGQTTGTAMDRTNAGYNARNQRLQELSALLQATGSIRQPGQSGQQAPDIQGAMQANYQGRLGAYNANQASNNAMLGAGLSALGTIGAGLASSGAFAGAGSAIMAALAAA